MWPRGSVLEAVVLGRRVERVEDSEHQERQRCGERDPPVPQRNTEPDERDRAEPEKGTQTATSHVLTIRRARFLLLGAPFL
jgi:hypothetical protein